MTLTFDLSKLTIVKTFTLSTLFHNKISNKKFNTIDALQMQIEKITVSSMHPITTQLSLAIVILIQ